VKPVKISPIAAHLERFREAIYSVEGHCLDCTSVGSLLQYAAGIRTIDYSAASEAGMYCSGIADYEREQELILTPFLTAQSIFLLTWMALEKLIGEIPEINDKLGKIGGLCATLTSQRRNFDEPFGYAVIVDDWRTLESSLDPSYRARTTLPSHVDFTGEGIYRVYSFRNHIFHGDFEGYHPEDERWEAYTQAMSIGIRLTELTIQMALSIRLQSREFMETHWHRRLFENEDTVSIREGFSKLHLELC
jgi:hypothetical protein